MALTPVSSALDEKLSPNFTLREMTKTDTGLSNLPTSEHKANLKRLALKLEGLRLVLGPMVVVSAYRSQAVQTQLKTAGSAAEQAQAATKSLHSEGIAADIQPLKMSAEKAWAIIAADPTLKASLGEIALKSNVLHISLPTPTKQGVLMEVINNQYIRTPLEKVKEIIARNQVAAAAGGGTLLLLGALGAFLYFRSRKKR